MDRGIWQATVHVVARVGHDLATKPPTTILEKYRISAKNSIFGIYGFIYSIHPTSNKMQALSYPVDSFHPIGKNPSSRPISSLRKVKYLLH